MGNRQTHYALMELADSGGGNTRTRKCSGPSFHATRETSFRRMRRWASRFSLQSGSDKQQQQRQQQQQQQQQQQRQQQQRQQQQQQQDSSLHDPEVQKGIAKKWNRESRKRIRSSTLFNKFGSSKAKWPVPFIESLFLPDFPVRGGPQEMEDFEVLDVIAAGSFGNVLKVRGEDNKKIYALKVIDKARLVLNGHAVVNQSKDEVSIQTAVGHSSFVADLLGHWQTRKRLYLLLEFYPNGELFALWRLHGKFSESLTRLYVAEMACALDFLHRADVVFRDLKLENIVMDAVGHLVLIDFGLSKWLKSGQSTRTLCGTLAYSAPEMLSGHPYSHSVDWWSLGILFYALVTGKFPLQGAQTCREMAHRVRRHEYEAPSSLTWECRFTLEQLLQKSPTRRVASLSAISQTPYFKGRINFDLVRSRSYDPRGFHTQLDFSGRPGDEKQRRLTQRRPPPCCFDPACTEAEEEEEAEQEAVHLIEDDSFFVSGSLSSREFYGTQL